jgi:hypothetical protein
MKTRRGFLRSTIALGAAARRAAATLSDDAVDRFGVIVYGATAAGVTAALEASRAGCRTLLLEPGHHVGGMTSGGLGATDFGKKAAIGGLAREFYRRIKHVYQDPTRWRFGKLAEYQAPNGHYNPAEDEMWTFEPHIAEEVFRAMLDECHVQTEFGQRLNLQEGVRKTGRRIESIAMESGRRYAAEMFIDATYEGDLMACSGVRYTLGRESNSQYGESYNGVQHRKWARAEGGEFGAHFPRAVDPYVRPGDPSSGLLFGVHQTELPPDGTGDRRVQAYNFRLCLTDVPENRVPFFKPARYDPGRYELLLRLLTSDRRFEELPALPEPDHPALGRDPTIKLMPNRKTDSNTKGAVGSDFVGGSWDYPEADHAGRARIRDEHVAYHQGLLWFVANDPRVPERYRLPMRNWGLAADEFQDTDHWPHQLYVREARRMVGPYVMTEHTCTGRDVPADSIGLASYSIDSHMVSRYVDERGRVQNEGHVLTSGLKPYPVSYRAIIPQPTECENLLVLVCLSASHTAYGSIRMEPVFMILGQSAGVAAALAIERKLAVQQIAYDELAARLVQRGQKLTWG